MRSERESGLMIPPGGGSTAGGRRRGTGDRGRGGRSKGRWLSVASTFGLLSSLCVGVKTQEAHLILHEYSPEAVKQLEWRYDMTLNEY